jgi:hypothetical protein
MLNERILALCVFLNFQPGHWLTWSQQTNRGDSSQEAFAPARRKKEVHAKGSPCTVSRLTSLPAQDVAGWMVYEESTKNCHRVPDNVNAGQLYILSSSGNHFASHAFNLPQREITQPSPAGNTYPDC